MRLTIDRFEGRYAVCEDEERYCFAIPTEELPEGAGEGSVLAVSKEGGFTLDPAGSQQRREKLAEMQRRLFER